MEQTRSSSETKLIVDGAYSEGREGKKEEDIINPAIVIKKHLTDIYQRLDQLEARVEKHVELTGQRIDAVDRTKLSVQEFRRFVDVLNKTLTEALHTVARADSPTPAPSLNAEDPLGGASTLQKAETGKMVNEKAMTALLYSSPHVSSWVSKTHELSFPLKTNGEIFFVGNGVTAVIGDAVIPSRTTVDEALVVKGNLKTGEACTLLKDIKALRNIDVGRDSTVEGNLVSGGKIILGMNCQVKGTLQGAVQEAEKDNHSHII